MVAKNSLVTLVVALTLGLSPTSFANTATSSDTNTSPKANSKNAKGKMSKNKEKNSAQKNEKYDDSTITKNIQDKLKENDITNSANIEVETKKGIVDLKGDVKNNEVASEAVQIAESVPGVLEVEINHLTIDNKKQNTDHAFNDAMTTAKIKGRFLREKIFGEKPIAIWTIAVETKDGIVILTGTADSEAEINNAKRIAKSVKSAKNVESQVRVK